MIVAARVDKSSTAYCRKDLVSCEDVFWERVKETHHLFAQRQFGQNLKISKLFKEKYSSAFNHR